MAGHNHESNDTKTWFAASDAYIREVRFQEVLSRQAYVLFYERVRTKILISDLCLLPCFFFFVVA